MRYTQIILCVIRNKFDNYKFLYMPFNDLCISHICTFLTVLDYVFYYKAYKNYIEILAALSKILEKDKLFKVFRHKLFCVRYSSTTYLVGRLVRTIKIMVQVIV